VRTENLSFILLQGSRQRQDSSIRVKQEKSNNSLKVSVPLKILRYSSEYNYPPLDNLFKGFMKDKEGHGRRSRACDTGNSDEKHLAKWKLLECCIVVERHNLIEEAVENGLRSIKVDQH
jgi:hypothetical protein